MFLKVIVLVAVCISASNSLKLAKSKPGSWSLLYSDSNSNRDVDRPQSIPQMFDADDFIRDDRLLKRSPPAEPYKPPPKAVKPPPRKEDKKEYDPQPTGYANWEAEDEREEEESRRLKEQDQDYRSEVEDYVERTDADKLLVTLSNSIKNLLVDDKYDSRRTKSARSVIKSIGTLSFLIGCAFTLVFYAFPDFISFRGNKEYSARYTNMYVNPEDLLNQQYPPAGVDTGENFDNALPPIKEQTRFQPNKNLQSAPYGRAEEL